MNSLQIICGDALTELRKLPNESVHCCVTSPPYWNLRDYNVPGQIGLEESPTQYVGRVVEVFSEVRRILRDDGTCWIVIGDSYSGSGKGGNPGHSAHIKQASNHGSISVRNLKRDASKPKDLVGIPWMVAFSLRDDGWYLRSEITWCKKSPMPESVTDRPSSATEKIFLLTKSAKYFYDVNAVRNPPSEAMLNQIEDGYNGTAKKLFDDNHVQNASSVKIRIIANARKRIDKQRGHSRRHADFNDHLNLTEAEQMACGSNLRNYWLLGPQPSFENHFATFPSEIPRRCILAGCPVGGTVLDCFAGSGTTGAVGTELGRNAILIELNPEYCEIAAKTCNTITHGLPF